MSKRSRISLYSSDQLDERGFHIDTQDAVTTMTSPNEMAISAVKVDFVHPDTPAKNITDVGQYLVDLSAKQQTESDQHAAGITTCNTNIASNTTQILANHAALGVQIGNETAARAAADATIEASVVAEAVVRTAQDNILAQAVTDETQARQTAIAAEVVLRNAAVNNLQTQLDALGVTDSDTLASINSMLQAYQDADNTISGLITALTNRVTELENIVSTLTV